uniref:makorin, ring finger protein, 4 isoform X3 n=1 Tax=Gasterosteus aculeatus aculeatus TaxID=481459 RepID=UPI001A9826DF|nr:makorin, ring finger protein, 4 isoform X3 [Gasterosteus aculeatus aculeatus]
MLSTHRGWTRSVVEVSVGASSMALADLVQDVVTDMNGPICHHPKYVGTSRKVHAGTVKAAGISTSFNLMQLLQVEEVRYLWFPLQQRTLHPTGEGRRLLFHKLTCCPGSRTADHSCCLASQILNTTLGSRHQILLRSNLKLVFFSTTFSLDNAPLTAAWQSVQSSEAAQACAGTNEQETSNETMGGGGAAAAAVAAFSTQGNGKEMETFLRSENVTCGICMDKVYEKTDPRNHVFGILPNCNHSFCLQCIMTWRKTKDLGPDVVKSCPQCRVRSAFYVPHKQWVEGHAKERVVAAFKDKFSKKRCSYYTRYRCCPFKTECLYWHDIPPHHESFPPWPFSGMMKTTMLPFLFTYLKSMIFEPFLSRRCL